MKILMKATKPGSEDGATTKTYLEGATYELADTEGGDALGEVFIENGWAEEAPDETEGESAKPKRRPKKPDPA